MIVECDCENKHLKGPFSLSCGSDTQSQSLSASRGIDVSRRLISHSASQIIQQHCFAQTDCYEMYLCPAFNSFSITAVSHQGKNITAEQVTREIFSPNLGKLKMSVSI